MGPSRSSSTTRNDHVNWTHIIEQGIALSGSTASRLRSKGGSHSKRGNKSNDDLHGVLDDDELRFKRENDCNDNNERSAFTVIVIRAACVVAGAVLEVSFGSKSPGKTYPLKIGDVDTKNQNLGTNRTGLTN